MEIIISGAAGAMGREVAAHAASESDIKIVAGFDKNAPSGAFGFEMFESPAACTFGADAVIDFSHFSAVPSLMEYCLRTKTPIVVATTALGEGELEMLREASRHIPVFRSANMSLGINVMSKMAKTAVPAIEADFNVEIIEKHHNRKADSPSGTALMLAEAVNEACASKKDFIFGRHGKSDVCRISDIGIHAVRGGTLPGQHTLMFIGPDEVIEISHTSYSRRVFAIGAVKAARFIAGREPGMYSMDDLLL